MLITPVRVNVCAPLSPTYLPKIVTVKVPPVAVGIVATAQLALTSPPVEQLGTENVAGVNAPLAAELNVIVSTEKKPGKPA
jgi:hypothetical protein